MTKTTYIWFFQSPHSGLEKNNSKSVIKEKRVHDTCKVFE